MPIRRPIIAILILLLLHTHWVASDTTRYVVTVHHPAFEPDDPTEFVLVGEETDEGEHIYYLDVESVICAQHICKIVPVRMYWGAMGNYLKYELQEGVLLEKKEGDPFLPEDYALLHQVLLDENSPYKEITYHEITHEKVLGEGQIDGMSGATGVILEEGKTVAGASWTCFTLWHWAHGDMVQEIRKITSSKTSNEELVGYLSAGRSSEQAFALTALAERQRYDTQTVQAVIALAMASGSTSSLVMKYLEQAPPAVYFAAIETLYLDGKTVDRMLYLHSLRGSAYRAAASFYERLMQELPNIKDYQEVDTLFTIIENAGVTSPAIQRLALGLLDSDQLVVARRAYWYLADQSLSPADAQKRTHFYNQYKELL